MIIKLLVAVVIGLTIIAKEEFYINEEIIVILSFIMFVVMTIQYLGRSLADTLDAESAQITSQLSLLNSQRQQVLTDINNTIQRIENQLPVVEEMFIISLKAIEGAVDNLGDSALNQNRVLMHSKLEELVQIKKRLESKRDDSLVGETLYKYFTK